MRCESVAKTWPLGANVLYLRLHFVCRQLTRRTYDNYAAKGGPML